MTFKATDNNLSQPIDPDTATQRYKALMDIVSNRITTREFDSSIKIPREHFEMILDAARHAPSGANAQPWHFIVVTNQETKEKITEYFVGEQKRRAELKMKFPTPNYKGLATAPGFIVVVSDFRWVRAFPVLKDDTSELNKMYLENAERIHQHVYQGDPKQDRAQRDEKMVISDLPGHIKK